MTFQLDSSTTPRQLDPVLAAQSYFDYPFSDPTPLDDFVPFDNDLYIAPSDLSDMDQWSPNSLFNSPEPQSLDFNIPSSSASTTSTSSRRHSEADLSDSDQAPEVPRTKNQKPSRRIPHSVVEQRYRHSVNSAIQSLRLSIPHLSALDSELGSRARPSKTTILVSGVEYIKKLERQRDRLVAENNRLRDAAKRERTLFE